MVVRREIKCRHCGEWFESPILSDDGQSIENPPLNGYTVQCPHCHKMTPCDKEDVRLVEE